MYGVNVYCISGVIEIHTDPPFYKPWWKVIRLEAIYTKESFSRSTSTLMMELKQKAGGNFTRMLIMNKHKHDRTSSQRKDRMTTSDVHT